MKKLKRIESVLGQTSGQGTVGTSQSSQFNPAIAAPDPRPISFDVQSKKEVQSKLEAKPKTGAIALPSQDSLPISAAAGNNSGASFSSNDSALSWQIASVSPAQEINLSLPRVATSGFTTHRNAANPALAMNLLKEIETLVAGWQVELQQILKQIQDLYLEGAIVDGWLESYAQDETHSPTLRHAEVDCLIDYVEKTWGSSHSESIAPAENPPLEANASGYRLCGLNQDGQLWFRHCPPEQIPVVSLAIARYQKLKLLLNRKQSLETRLSQLAETLIAMHAELKQD